ncbi:MAG: GntR family transcriptional regulator [Solirubrobacterales bacterium]
MLTAIPPDSVEHRSPVPRYFQLAELIEHEITHGRWVAGARLPSEPELAAHFGLSRSVIRQALGRLEAEGLVSRRRGQGTFVLGTQPRSWLLQSSEGFFQEEAGRLDREVTSTVLRAEREVLPHWAAAQLELGAGTEGVTLERLRSIDGLVALYVVNHLPARYAETALAAARPGASLYELLAERDGARVAGARRSVEAVAASELLARLLEVARGTPLVSIKSVSWDRNLTPFDCFRAWLRTDRMRIDIQVAATPSSLPAAVPKGED